MPLIAGPGQRQLPAGNCTADASWLTLGAQSRGRTGPPSRPSSLGRSSRLLHSEPKDRGAQGTERGRHAASNRAQPATERSQGKAHTPQHSVPAMGQAQVYPRLSPSVPWAQPKCALHLRPLQGLREPPVRGRLRRTPDLCNHDGARGVHQVAPRLGVGIHQVNGRQEGAPAVAHTVVVLNVQHSDDAQALLAVHKL